MQWLKTLISLSGGLLPAATSMWPVVVLVFSVGAAIGGWTGWKLTSNAAKAAQTESLQLAFKQAQQIAAQDAEILTAHEIQYRTIIKTKEVAHATLDHSAVPDCRLDDDGLRAVQSIYQTDPGRAHAVIGLVQSAESARGWAPDYHLAQPDRGGVGLP